MFSILCMHFFIAYFVIVTNDMFDLNINRKS